ncbi:GNAT family N-acetyltransferase [uncultured Microscilla sp.]|uniref:GNAT family N-acetyltransferase n=1 Tax=uncultured Microscilla sp. TaxID=432653 RepID=UPI00261B30FE|nr:GNAT family N-acetyltransferase [uncultured Microscilla sp.]
MQYLITKALNDTQKEQVRTIWNRVYPAQIGHSNILSFEKYLAPLHNATHWLVQTKQAIIKGWFITFDRHNDRWFAMLLNDDIQGQGIGSGLLQHAQAQNKVLNGWVIDHHHYVRKDGQTYISPIEFYIKNGFQVLTDQRLETEQLSLVKVRWEV